MTDARVVEILAPYVSDERRARIEAVLGARLRGVSVLVEDVHEPHNAAAVLRTCEALGIGEVHVVESVETFRPADKVTQGAEKWLSLHRHANVKEAITALRAGGFVTAGAAPEADQELGALPVDQPIALVFGNEHRGLSAAARADLDRLFRIPQHGFTRSLNISVAVAVAAFDVCRRVRADLGAAGDLDESARLALRARFYRDSVSAADAILRREAR